MVQNFLNKELKSGPNGEAWKIKFEGDVKESKELWSKNMKEFEENEWRFKLVKWIGFDEDAAKLLSSKKFWKVKTKEIEEGKLIVVSPEETKVTLKNILKLDEL